MSRSTVSAVVAPEVLPFTLPVVRRTMCEVLYVARAWGYTEDVLPMKVRRADLWNLGSGEEALDSRSHSKLCTDR